MNEIKEKLKELVEQKKVTFSSIAKGVNKSPTTISQYMAGNYPGDIEALEKDLNKYLELFKKQDEVENKKLTFVETSVAKKLNNAANLCHLQGKLGACYGAPGIGKTTAIKEYKKVNSSVIVVDPFEGSSVRSILKQIATQLKVVYTENMSHEEFANHIIKRLLNNRTLIIIDEAENIKVDSLRIIRKIHDKTDGACGVLLVGTNELYALLSKVKSGLPYISNRVAYLEKLDALKKDDVEKLVRQYFADCPIKLVEYFAKATGSNARALQNILDLSLAFIRSNKIALDIDVIDAARERLLI